MRLETAQQNLTSRASVFVAARPIHAARANRTAGTSRQHVQQPSRTILQVEAAKGKQAMRRGGGGNRNSPMMPQIPTPPVDPENVEFVIFVRSKKLPQWMPLSVMKGGGPANMLVKALENDIGKKLYGNTLVENVGRAIYKDRVPMENAIRTQFPMFKAAKEFEYGFKVRDKERPKDWYLVTPDLQVIPPEEELGTTPIEGATNFFKDLGKGLGLSQ